MADIRHQVELIIESDPVIKKGLQRGIINSRALARYILEADGLNATQDAVLGAIRRYPLVKETEPAHREVFKNCAIITRNKMANLAIENSPDIMKKIADFAATVKSTRGENLRVVVGTRSIRVIAEQKVLESLRQSLQPKEIISYGTDLAEISLLFAHEAEGIKGVKGIAARITTRLALNDVDLAGLFFCSPEDTIMVADADASRALVALQQLLREETGSYIDTVVYSRTAVKRRTGIQHPEASHSLLAARSP